MDFGWVGFLVIAGIVLFLLFSSWNKKRQEKLGIQRFHRFVEEYIYERKILNPFVIYNEVENCKDIPREVLRKLNAFDYIDDRVKKAKEEKRG